MEASASGATGDSGLPSVQKKVYVIRVGRQYLSRSFRLVDDPRKAYRYSRAYDAYRHAPSYGGCTYSLALALEEQERGRKSA